MKKVTALFLVVAILVCMFSAVDSASAQLVTGMNAVIISTRASVRVAKDTKSELIASLNNGEQMLVTGEENGWYVVDLVSIGKDEGIGYIQKRYVKLSPDYITLPKSVILWSDPWGTGLANGSKSEGTIMLVLSETAEWLCVQTTDWAAGASFISKAELYGNSEGYSGQGAIDPNNRPEAVVACSTLAVRRNPNDDEEPVGYLHYGDIVEIVNSGEYFTGVVWEIAGYKAQCWVHTEHLQELIQ